MQHLISGFTQHTLILLMYNKYTKQYWEATIGYLRHNGKS